MKILVIGNGGREHAIAWKLHKDDPAAELFCAPGNAGTAAIATNVPIAAKDVPGLVAWAKENCPDFTVVGPEVPLCLGVVDAFQEAGLAAFGPVKATARMEGSKAFAKEIMRAAQVPTADDVVVRTEAEAREAIARLGVPVVLKADGLAAGKGVSVCMDQEQVEAALRDMFVDAKFGDSAREVLVEQYLEGEEASVLAFVDGATVVPLASAQDHKRLLDGDQGPNTGGMGAYSPAPCMTPDMLAVVKAQVLQPVVDELARRGTPYHGVLYAGLMLTENGPKVLEFNCRFGDPETEAILPRLSSPLLPALRACMDGTLADGLRRLSGVLSQGHRDLRPRRGREARRRRRLPRRHRAPREPRRHGRRPRPRRHRARRRRPRGRRQRLPRRRQDQVRRRRLPLRHRASGARAAECIMHNAECTMTV